MRVAYDELALRPLCRALEREIAKVKRAQGDKAVTAAVGRFG